MVRKQTRWHHEEENFERGSLFFVFSQCDVEPTTFVVLLGLLCLFSCVVGFYVVHDFEACGALLAVKVHYVGAHLEAFAT